MRLIEGKFPPYGQVIPKTVKRTFKVSKKALLSSLKRIATLSSDKSLGVKLTLSPKSLELTAINPDFGEGHEDIEVEYKGDKFEIGFNTRYLSDAISILDEDVVEIQLGDEVAPAMIKSDKKGKFTHVIMPMRL